MNYLWNIGQFGIGFEIIGAGFIVFSAYTSRNKMKGLRSTMDGLSGSVDSLTAVIKSQFKNELFGFVLLGLGLIMQLAGGFANNTQQGTQADR